MGTVTLLDISAPLTDAIPVWPGDVPFRLRWSHRVEAGAPFTLASVELSLHTGSHLDAPAHVLAGGTTVDQIPLDACVGPARLVSVSAADLIEAADLEPFLADAPPRLLFRLQPACVPGPSLSASFPAFSASAAEALVRTGVRLVGVDTPSVDAADADFLPAHRVFAAAGVVILENLRFGAVADGDYELIALPLRIAGAEASPVRAVLRPWAVSAQST